MCAGPVCRMPLFMQIGCVLACVGSWLRYVPFHATCLHWPPLKLCLPGAPAHLTTHVQRQQQKDASKEKSKIATQLGKVRQGWSLAGGRALQWLLAGLVCTMPPCLAAAACPTRATAAVCPDDGADVAAAVAVACLAGPSHTAQPAPACCARCSASHPLTLLCCPSSLLLILLQIQKIMEEKGYDHAAAFARPRRERGEGGEGGGGEGAGPAGAFTKKRRI